MKTGSVQFGHIGILGKLNHSQTIETAKNLLDILNNLDVDVAIESHLFSQLGNTVAKSMSVNHIAEHCDLVFAIGGDGSMLSAGRKLAETQVPLVGINQGRLGFLADINPNDLNTDVEPLLNGIYKEEHRFLLTAEVKHCDGTKSLGTAVNDLVLHQGEIARMIEFEVEIDGNFVYSQRSDGLIVSTPTGSTAYALSSGGPILPPGQQSIVLVPKCPHTLSSRPLVIHSGSEIEIKFPSTNPQPAHLSFDAQNHTTLYPGDRIIVRRAEGSLKLLHPRSYDYYHVLRTKLGWGTAT